MSLSVRSGSPGISLWAHGTRRVGGWGEERERERERERDRQTDRRGGEEREGRGREFSSTAYGKADWSSSTKHPFHTPDSPQNLRAQESTQKELWETRDSDSRGHAYKHCFCFFSSFFKITFPILEDALLKKSQFKIVLKTYLKIGL